MIGFRGQGFGFGVPGLGFRVRDVGPWFNANSSRQIMTTLPQVMVVMRNISKKEMVKHLARFLR